jgi:4-hydroxybenzoate polyprenyltransferase
MALFRFDRPIGNFLLLWPTWWALWLAGDGSPAWLNVVVFTLGVLVMRAAGCAINDFADRRIDPHVKRTKTRPLADGRLQAHHALIGFLAMMSIALGLVLLTNPLTVILAFVGAGLASLYPFTKRYTDFPQVVLGAAFGWAVPMAFAAETGSVPALAWLVFSATLIWTTAYDTLYGMVDRDDDLKIGVRSTAILFGDADRLIVGVLQGTFLLAMMLVGQRGELGWPYWLGLAVAGALLAYQQWLIRERRRDNCFKAFLNNNWVGAAIFAGLLLAYWLT